MTLVHLFHLLFPKFTALFSSCFFWKHLFFSLSLLKFIFSVIPKAVLLLVVIGIVGCGLADSVKPLRKWGDRLVIFLLYLSKNQSLFQASWVPLEMPGHGPSFCMHRTSSTPASPPKKRSWVIPQPIIQEAVRDDRAFPAGRHKGFCMRLLPKGHTMET